MNPSLDTALRNALVIKWLRALTPLSAKLIAREYAERLGCPLDEVNGALDEITDQTDLDWLWERYRKEIEA